MDQRYADHGVIEAYVVLDDVPRIANTQGVGSVILELRPIHSAGAVTSHRILLDVLGGVIVERPAGLGIEPGGPVQLVDILLAGHE